MPVCCRITHQLQSVDPMASSFFGYTKWYNLNRIELNLVATSLCARRLRIIFSFFCARFPSATQRTCENVWVQIRCQATNENTEKRQLPYVPASDTVVDLRRNFGPQKCTHLHEFVCVSASSLKLKHLKLESTNGSNSFSSTSHRKIVCKINFSGVRMVSTCVCVFDA